MVLISHILTEINQMYYSKNEILKLTHFDKIATIILEKCKKYIDLNEKTYCQIEGYSSQRIHHLY